MMKYKIYYLLEVVKKFSIVVTPSVTRAGSAFHSIQKVTNEEVTRIIPGDVFFTPSYLSVLSRLRRTLSLTQCLNSPSLSIVIVILHFCRYCLFIFPLRAFILIDQC